MKLAEVTDVDYDRYDQERMTRHRVFALKVQQAIAELDGWELDLTPPKPMDKHTGEVFPWTGVAVHENGQHLDVTIHSRDVIFDMGIGVHADLAWPIEKIASAFKTAYDSQLETALEIIRSDLDFKLEDELERLTHQDGDENHLRIALKKAVYEPYVADWLANPANKAGCIVNSKKLANDMVKQIYEIWVDVLETRLNK